MSIVLDPLGYNFSIIMQLPGRYLHEWNSDLVMALSSVEEKFREMRERIWIYYDMPYPVSDMRRAFYRAFFIEHNKTGIPANEEQFREILSDSLGKADTDYKIDISGINTPLEKAYKMSARGTEFHRMQAAFREARKAYEEGFNPKLEVPEKDTKQIEKRSTELNGNDVTDLSEPDKQIDALDDEIRKPVESAVCQTAETARDAICEKTVDAIWKCLNCPSDDMHEIRFATFQQRNIFMLKIRQSYDAVEDVYRIYFAIALPHIVFAEDGGKLQAAFVELLEKYCSKARYARAMCGKDVLNVGVCWSDEEQGFRLLYPAINEKTPEQKEFPGVQWGMYFPPEMVAKLGGVNAVWEWNALEVIRELENGGIWVQVSDDIDIYPYRNCVVLYEKLSEHLWHGEIRINSMRFPSFRLPVKRENIRLIGGTDVDCIV